MRWEGRRQSSNVEDRRGLPMGGIAGGGLLVLAVIAWALFTGQDPSRLLQQLDQAPPSEGAGQAVDPAQEPLRDFVGVVLADTDGVWGQLFPSSLSRPYEPPRLVLFTGGVDSACGLASSAAGPFYCASDRRAYLDLDFFSQLASELNAPGDFAMAYVIAHEIGHH